MSVFSHIYCWSFVKFGVRCLLTMLFGVCEFVNIGTVRSFWWTLMKLCSPACLGVHHVPSCCIRQARRRTAVCSVRLLPSHSTEGRTSQSSQSTAVCQLEIHCTAFNKLTHSLYVWIEPVKFTNACVLYR